MLFCWLQLTLIVQLKNEHPLGLCTFELRETYRSFYFRSVRYSWARIIFSAPSVLRSLRRLVRYKDSKLSWSDKSPFLIWLKTAFCTERDVFAILMWQRSGCHIQSQEDTTCGEVSGTNLKMWIDSKLLYTRKETLYVSTQACETWNRGRYVLLRVITCFWKHWRRTRSRSIFTSGVPCSGNCLPQQGK